MGKQSLVKTGPRPVLDPRETFRMTTPDLEVRAQPTARPVEHFANREDGGALANFAADAMQAMSTGIQGERYRKVNEEKRAETDFFSGNVQEDKSGYYQWKVENLQGSEAASAEFQESMKEILQDARAHDSEWYEAKKADLIGKFYKHPSRHFREGFARQAKHIETKFDMEQQDTKIAFIKNTRAQGLRKKFIGDLEAAIGQGLKGDDLTAYVREAMSSEASNYKEWFTTSESMAHILQAMNLYGLENGGMPELFNAAFIKDATGNAPGFNPQLAQHIEQYRSANLAHRETLANKAQQERMKAERKYVAAILKDAADATRSGDPASLAAAQAAILEARNMDAMNPGTYQSTMNLFQKIQRLGHSKAMGLSTGTTKPKFNPVAFMQAYARYTDESLPLAERQNALMDAMGSGISEGQQLTFAKAHVDNLDAMRDDGWKALEPPPQLDMDIENAGKQASRIIVPGDIDPMSLDWSQGVGAKQATMQKYLQVRSTLEVAGVKEVRKLLEPMVRADKPISTQMVQDAWQAVSDKFCNQADVPPVPLFAGYGKEGEGKWEDPKNKTNFAKGRLQEWRLAQEQNQTVMPAPVNVVEVLSEDTGLQMGVAQSPMGQMMSN